MMMNDDMALVREFADGQSDRAFETLVARHIHLVHSAALRRVRDPHLAEEITQAVFIILARKAGSLAEKTILSGWLYRTAQYASADALKMQRRRQRREQEAHMQSILENSGPQNETWNELAPLLDEAMLRLRQTDRDAVVLRYFENKSLREVGGALGLQERAAQKRIARALEKLRTFFEKRGVTLSAAAIAGAVSANSVQAAPVALTKSVTAVAIAKGAVASGSTITIIKGALKLMAWSKAKITIVTVVGILLAAGTVTVALKKFESHKIDAFKNPAISAQLKAFVTAKEAQATAGGGTMLPEFKRFFAAAEKQDWQTMDKIFKDLKNHAPQYDHSGKTDLRLAGTAWSVVIETDGAFGAFADGDAKYVTAFGNDVINSIPPGSIYFGGTDPGRFVVTVLQKSHENADPFFTLTQNALVDGSYLDYLRSMYGGKIYTPTDKDSQQCFNDYIKDAKLRFEEDRLKPGENVKVDADGQVQVSGRVAVMEINGLLAKIIFDKNPGREFYIEESAPLDWMYPYLEPHGLIFKINRQPLTGLSDEIIQQDHDYWTKYVTPMIGDWLNYDTPVADVTAFAEKVFLRHDFNGFTGDPRFVQNEYVRKTFSHLRYSIADAYAWRMEHAAASDEMQRMAREADFAFRQALALCPDAQEVREGYVNFLKARNRNSDANLVAALK
jgi:RNA polymerase sigma factor (sigma-70 family)